MNRLSGRRSLLAAFVAGTLAIAAGCAQSEQAAKPEGGASPAPAGGAPAKSLKVGLVTPGKITDGGWCQSANDGLERIKTELGAETVPAVENPAPAELAATARNLAQGGANLVFFHGAEYDKPIAAVAKDFPGTTFVVVGGREVSANVVPIQFAEREAGYIAGMVAAGMSKTHKIAAVGGTKIAIIESSFDAFKAGAKAADPNCDVKIVFTGSFEDQGKAKQQTQALIESGVDVVMHNANEAGKGVAQAVEESKSALFIGANSDQSDLATKRNLGSFIIDSVAAYAAVAKAVKDGTAAGKPFKGGIAAKAVYFKFNDKFDGTVPDAVRAKVSEAEAAITAGTVTP